MAADTVFSSKGKKGRIFSHFHLSEHLIRGSVPRDMKRRKRVKERKARVRMTMMAR